MRDKAKKTYVIPAFKVGDDIRYDDHSNVRVMAIADGYVMIRRPGCIPFIKTVKELNDFRQ